MRFGKIAVIAAASAALVGGGGLNPAFAAGASDPIKDWTSLTDEVQKLISWREANGLPMGGDWQKSCRSVGEVANSGGADAILESAVPGDESSPLTTSSVVRFANARSQIMPGSDGTASWDLFTVDIQVCSTPAPVPPTAPESIDGDGKDDYVVIPEGYYFSDAQDPTYIFPPGKFKVPSSYYVNGTATFTITLAQTDFDGVTIYEVNPNAPHSWTYTFDGRQKVNPTSVPTVSDGSFSSDEFTVPATTDYSWELDGSGTTLTPGTYKVSDYATYGDDGYATLAFLPVINDPLNYVLTSEEATTLHARNFEYAVASDPDASDGFMGDDVLTLPTVTGGKWSVNGVAVDAGAHNVSDVSTYNASGVATLDVSLDADTNYKFNLDGADSGNGGKWKFTAKNYESVTTPKITTVDADGPNDSYTIPSTTGVTYTDADGNVLTPGEHTATGDIVVNMVTASGYKFEDGTTSASFKDHLNPYYLAGAVVAPEFVDDADTNDVITLTKAAGITWYVNGKAVDAGSHKISEFMESPTDSVAVTVTFAVASDYELRAGSVTGPWSHTFDTRTVVADVAPTAKDEDGPADVLTLPAVTGATWTVNGVESTGSVTTTGHVDVVLSALPGYVLSTGQKTQSWSYDLESTFLAGTPTAATTTDKPGVTSDALVIPATKGVTYSVDGTVKAAGTYSVSDLTTYKSGTATVKVTASAADGYRLPENSTTSWTFTFTESSTIPAATSPTFGTSAVTIPSAEGISYTVLVDGVKTPVSGTVTAPVHGTITIYAAPVYGYAFDNGKTEMSWSKAYDRRTRVTATAPTFTAATETTKAAVTIPVKAGVTYSIDGTVKEAGTYQVEGASVKVTAASSDENTYVLDGTTAWTFDATPSVDDTGTVATPPSTGGKEPNENGVVSTEDGVVNERGVVNEDRAGTVDGGVATVNELRKTGSPVENGVAVGSVLLIAGAAVLASASVRRRRALQA